MWSTDMEATSSKAGVGNDLNEYDISDGWIMMAAFVAFSLFNNMRK